MHTAAIASGNTSILSSSGGAKKIAANSIVATMVTLPIAVNGHIVDAGDRSTFGFDLQAGRTFVAVVQAAVVTVLTLFDPGETVRVEARVD